MYKRSLLVFIVFVLPYSVAFAQWVPTHLPGARTVYSLAATSDRVFAGTDYDVYMTDNNGANWYSQGLGVEFFQAFTELNGNLFTGSTEHGVTRSTDDGAT
ncbi:MAG TPA: hypothetical protein VFJ29_02435, partial [Candidatus Kapabacteria bacterium]|nr:hypothetical protein [Candidatus Kapabacteria bacterium]